MHKFIIANNHSIKGVIKIFTKESTDDPLRSSSSVWLVAVTEKPIVVVAVKDAIKDNLDC